MGCMSSGVVPAPSGPAYVHLVGTAFLHLTAQWAGATSIIALFGCIVAFALALQFSRQPFAPADAAFDLARRLALLGGTAVIVGCAASTLYWWRMGVASGAVVVAIETGLAIASLLFTVAVRALYARAPRA
jgi:hypothetical protein